MKVWPHFRQERGMALITVLLLGLFGAALVIGIFYMSKNLVTMSGIGSRYVRELEEAKGIVHFIAGTIMSPTRDLRCGVKGEKICLPNGNAGCNSSSMAYIYIPTNLYDSTEYMAKACYLFSVEDPESVEPYTMHGFWIEVSNPTTGEKVELDFVYKVK